MWTSAMLCLFWCKDAFHRIVSFSIQTHSLARHSQVTQFQDQFQFHSHSSTWIPSIPSRSSAVAQSTSLIFFPQDNQIGNKTKTLTRIHSFSVMYWNTKRQDKESNFTPVPPNPRWTSNHQWHRINSKHMQSAIFPRPSSKTIKTTTRKQKT